MTHSVYICENYEVNDDTLTIWGAKEVAKVDNETGFRRVMDLVKYNAIICPDIYQMRYEIKIILFV